MLTGDPVEAIEQARALLKDGTVLAYHDEILVGGLGLARRTPNEVDSTMPGWKIFSRPCPTQWGI
jgi:hypothetical protein